MSELERENLFGRIIDSILESFLDISWALLPLKYYYCLEVTSFMKKEVIWFAALVVVWHQQ